MSAAARSSTAPYKARFERQQSALRRRTKLLRLRLPRQRAADGRALGHPAAVVDDARESAGIDAVALQPAGEREEIRIGDRIGLAHHPRAAEQLALDEVETRADRLRHFP